MNDDVKTALIFLKDIKALVNNLIYNNINDKTADPWRATPYNFEEFPRSYDYVRNVSRPNAKYIMDRLDQYIEIFTDETPQPDSKSSKNS